MNTIKLSRAEMEVILDDNDKYEKIGFEKHYRHNGGDTEIVFEKDGKHYSAGYRWFEDDGVQWDDEYNATEVKQVEKIVKVWETVK